MAYDLLVKNGTIVDGTGGPRFRGDIAISDGRIVEVGRVAGSAKQTIDADGLVVAPGIVDVHTHYDAQVCWDPVLSSSAEHGTTTVVQGNCGIGVAPCRPEHREIALQDLVILEGMPYDVMNTGIDWEFESFAEYLDVLRRGGFGINIAPLVPLSMLRRYTMGEAASERGATPEERRKITADLNDALAAGGFGFSASMVKRQVGYQGKPLACRMADNDELKAYANLLAKFGRGAIQVNVLERLSYLDDSEYALLDFLLEESGGRPVTYSGAFYRNDDPAAIERMLQKAEPLRVRGAVPQTTIMPVTIEIDLRSPFAFADLAAFKPILSRPLDEQKTIYRDPEWRAKALAELSRGGKLFSSSWEAATVLRVKSERLRPLLMKSIADIAKERGKPSFDTMIDLALEDDLELKYLGDLVNSSPEHLRNHIKDPRVLLGLHDGGAHIDMMSQAGYPTYMLGHWVRDEQAIGLEHAIKRMTSETADYFGLHDRGRIAPGKNADIMAFDPATVDSPSRANEIRHDLPGGGMRLYTKPVGVEYVVVNGALLFEHGNHTGARPGRFASGQ
jgi:N-acyl-D-aspartate/D-glutamate deacylase